MANVSFSWGPLSSLLFLNICTLGIATCADVKGHSLSHRWGHIYWDKPRLFLFVSRKKATFCFQVILNAEHSHFQKFADCTLWGNVQAEENWDNKSFIIVFLCSKVMSLSIYPKWCFSVNMPILLSFFKDRMKKNPLLVAIVWHIVEYINVQDLAPLFDNPLRTCPKLEKITYNLRSQKANVEVKL